jgi:hypothetical protein
MIELVSTATGATASPTVGHDHLDHLISRIAAGDRAAFRCLYGFMAVRVWYTAVESQLCPADAAAVTRSIFLDVWHLAGTAARYDARDWMAAACSRHISDRLRTVGADVRRGVRPGQPYVDPDGHGQPPIVAHDDSHIHRELATVLGTGRATIRVSPGVYARIDDLDHALVVIASSMPPTTRQS